MKAIYGVAAALAGAAFLVGILAMQPRGPKWPDWREELPLLKEEGLAEAVRLYDERGAFYTQSLPGRNDCSSFIRDILRARGKAPPQEFNTKLMAAPGEMESYGWKVKAGDPSPGDLFLIRYRENTLGHTGIAVQHPEGLAVFHNAASAGGLVLETLDELRQRLETAGARWEDMKWYTPSS